MKQNPFVISQQGPQYKSGKLVGGYVPQSVYDYLRLLVVYREGTMQSVLRDLVEEYMTEKEPIPSIIEALADRAYLEWVRRGWDRKDDKSLYWEYKEELRCFLTKRKLSEENINAVIKAVRERIGTDK